MNEKELRKKLSKLREEENNIVWQLNQIEEQKELEEYKQHRGKYFCVLNASWHEYHKVVAFVEGCIQSAVIRFSVDSLDGAITLTDISLDITLSISDAQEISAEEFYAKFDEACKELGL